MRLYPESAAHQLELEKVKELLIAYCRTAFAIQKANQLRIHTKFTFIMEELRQTHEYKLLLQSSGYFPNDFHQNIHHDIKLLGIPGGILKAEQWMGVKGLTENIESIFRWMDNERRQSFPALANIIEGAYYEKEILIAINQIFEPNGWVKDDASPELAKIRFSLYKRRQELRRAFDRVLAKLQKQGYVADIEESFLNGRRVVALFAEHKRQVKGILHGESDTRKTVFIEPEETIELNNEVYSLEQEEVREVNKILQQLSNQLRPYATLLSQYLTIIGEYDFIRAKAKLAVDMDGILPNVEDKACLHLVKAYHPLLLLYNRKASKETIPLNLQLSDDQRILIISGPNAGGKTVSMKTVGLLQLMLQAGLLVPVHPTSTFGVFRQLMIHMGDTQSIEFELSTYSSHLQHMKYFLETANGKTMFFIDELGGGSDPSLGGAFAEVILEELTRKHSIGIVTTHYLNLKVMANRVKGIINGAMAFDEEHLMPLYRLQVGKPGSSYTFAIAERIGLPKHLINKAKKLVDDSHFKLDTLLNRTEQDLQIVQSKEKQLNQLLKENERLKREMETVLNKERHQQQIEILKHQNKVTEDKINYLKDTERKLKEITLQYRKETDKQKVFQQIENLLFKKKEQAVVNKLQKKVEAKFEELQAEIELGSEVKLKRNHQIGIVKELKGKNAVVQVGLMPMTIALADLVRVKKKIQSDEKS